MDSDTGEIITADQFLSTDDMPNVFNIPIINYFNHQVWCLGYFRKPTKEEIRTHSHLPYAIFQNAEPHGWKITCYSLEEVLRFIKEAKPI